MKKQITEEEYKKALKRLKFIAEERKNLEYAVENKQYIAHIALAENFEELLINLKRDNQSIDEEIKRAIKNFFSTITTTEEIKKDIKNIIKMQITKLENTPLEDEISENMIELQTIIAHFPEFETLYSNVKDSINRKKTNNYLANYISFLEEEADTLKIVTFNYEKQQKKRKKKISFFYHCKKKTKIIKFSQQKKSQIGLNFKWCPRGDSNA